MSKKFVREVDRGWNQIRAQLKALKQGDSYVKAGVLGDAGAHEGSNLTNVDLALIHEFGTRDGRIPERSFIRSSFEHNRAEYIENLRKLIKGVYENKMTIPRALGIMGLKMASDMKKGITTGEGIPPPNAPATIAAKGSSRPLVDRGRLVNSISHEVVVSGAKPK